MRSNSRFNPLIILPSFLILIGIISPFTSGHCCGFCKGDKAASVYSFKNQRFATKHQANYFTAELIGKGDEGSFKQAIASLGQINGIFQKTIRSDYSQKAVSFVFKKEINFDQISKRFSEAQTHWKLKLVQLE